MQQNLNPDIAILPRLTTSELRLRYAEVFGEQPSTWNRVWLLKRLAGRLQALAEGGLSQRSPTCRGVGQRRRCASDHAQAQDKSS